MNRVLGRTCPNRRAPIIVAAEYVEIEGGLDGWEAFQPTGRKRAWIFGVRVPVRLVVAVWSLFGKRQEVRS